MSMDSLVMKRRVDFKVFDSEQVFITLVGRFEPPHDKTNKMACVPTVETVELKMSRSKRIMACSCQNGVYKKKKKECLPTDPIFIWHEIGNIGCFLPNGCPHVCFYAEL